MGTLQVRRWVSRARPAGLRRAGASVPRALRWTLAVVAPFAVTWGLLVPPWQSPDEVAHFAYAQSLIAAHALPGRTGHPQVSSAQGFADNAVGASRGAFYPAPAPPDWSSADNRAYRVAAAHLSTGDGGGPNSASPNPPLYYAIADVGYLFSGSDSAITQLYAIRIFNVLLVLTTVIGGWLLAGEALGRQRIAQLGAAATCGLMPMETFIGTSVNPDTLLAALWTLSLWMGTRVINRRAPVRDVAVLCGLTAAAILTKGTSYALVPPVLLAILLGWLRRPRSERRRSVPALLAAGLVLVVPVLVWVAAAHALHRQAVNAIGGASAGSSFNVRRFLSYIWQFYLPRLPWMTPDTVTSDLSVYDLWIRQGLGTFGWLVVVLPVWVYDVAAAVVSAMAIVVVGVIARIRDRTRLAVLAFYGLAILSLLFGLHYFEFQSLVSGQGPVLQGRYLLPVIGLLGGAVALILTRLPLRVRSGACGLVLAGLMALQLVSMSAVAGAYYL